MRLTPINELLARTAVRLGRPRRTQASPANRLANVSKEVERSPRSARSSPPALSIRSAIMVALGTVMAFHLAYSSGALCFLMAVFCAGLFALSRLASPRQAFWFGVAVGVGCYAPRLFFFWTIFSQAALVLWLILAVWIGLFLALLCACRIRLGPFWAAALAPFLWTGLEYFRSELYWLKFSWLNVGYAFADSPQVYVIAGLGIYGIGFELMGWASLTTLLPRKARLAAAVSLLAALGLVVNRQAGSLPKHPATTGAVRVAGIQMEFPAELEAVQALGTLKTAHPEAELLVLSEYTLDGPVTRHFTNWCARNSRHVVVGGKDLLDQDRFFNTVFVIGPRGEALFRQSKTVPIQFFKDGLPAPRQAVWPSPWGRLGFAICYDLSYARVTDRLVEKGAQALIVPTMDVAEWGAGEHRLHARVAPMRAAEYGLPVFRLASSGISQLVDAKGAVRATAPYPGEKAMLAGDLPLVKSACLPIDRWLAPQSSWLAGLVALALLLPRWSCAPLRVNWPCNLNSRPYVHA